MSTCNFEPMSYNMPLIVSIPHFDYDEMAKDYEEEYGEELTDDIYTDEIQLTYDAEYTNMKYLADKMNDDLVYYTVDVKDGYYEGLQFVVNTYEDLDFDRNSPYCVDNEDTRYYFDECRSKVLRKADAERRRIYKWLKSLKDEGYMELHCDGVFSNGEAIYSIVK